MSDVKAPCGHLGERVIGTYVRCLSGCEGKPPAPHRGIQNHVPMCACKACTFCRRAHGVVIRSHDGRDIARVVWDGHSRTIRFKVGDRGGDARHVVTVDKDGVVLHSKPCEIKLPAGAMFQLDFKPEKICFELWRNLSQDIYHYEMRQTVVLGSPFTDDHIRRVALSFPGIRAVEVRVTQPYLVDVAITEADGNVDRALMVKLREALKKDCPAGMGVRVLPEHPQFKMQRAAMETQFFSAMKLRETNHKIADLDLFKRMVREYFTGKLEHEGYKAKDFDVIVKDGLDCFGGGLEVEAHLRVHAHKNRYYAARFHLDVFTDAGEK